MNNITIAIVGGDGRAQHLRWPRHIKLKFYRGEKWGSGELKRLANALANGQVDVVVALSRWMGHTTSDTIRRHARCRIIVWDRGLGELTRQLPGLLAGEKRVV